MKIEVTEALDCMKLLQALTQPTIDYLNALPETEFKVELAQARGAERGWLPRGQKACLVGPEPQDYQRLAAASILLARFLGAPTGR